MACTRINTVIFLIAAKEHSQETGAEVTSGSAQAKFKHPNTLLLKEETSAGYREALPTNWIIK